MASDFQVVLETGRGHASGVMSPDERSFTSPTPPRRAMVARRWQLMEKPGSLPTLPTVFPPVLCYVAADSAGYPVVYAVTTEASNNALVRWRTPRPGRSARCWRMRALIKISRSAFGAARGSGTARQRCHSITRENIILDWTGPVFPNRHPTLAGYLDVINGAAV